MENHLKAATVLTTLLDNQFNLFGQRVGLNSLIDLIPGFGDAAAAILSLYLVWIAIEMQLPRIKIAQMLWNILVNFLIGLIPVLGDAVYIFRKANVKNLKILQDYAKKHSGEGRVIQPRQYIAAR
ncbi:MAG: DUF4112 domain-containing protein [Candidatus Levyibacteriota bacterium]